MKMRTPAKDYRLGGGARETHNYLRFNLLFKL